MFFFHLILGPDLECNLITFNFFFFGSIFINFRIFFFKPGVFRKIPDLNLIKILFLEHFLDSKKVLGFFCKLNTSIYLLFRNSFVVVDKIINKYFKSHYFYFNTQTIAFPLVYFLLHFQSSIIKLVCLFSLSFSII